MEHIRTDFLSLSSRPSRGLVLLSDTHAVGRYWVCNPSTGECRALPPMCRRVSLSSVGLAFDDLTMDCKVVHLFFNDDNVRCEVLTLGGGGWRWRQAVCCTGLNQLDGPIGDDIVDALRVEEATVGKAPPVFADGCLHWLMRHPRRRGYRIDDVLPRQGQDVVLRFSAADESFGLVSALESVPLEDYIRLEEHQPMVLVHLVELKGLLCMVHDRRGSQLLDVWARSARGEWSLDYRIPASPLLARGVHQPQGVSNRMS